jgi:hypothetical protein
MMPSKLLTFMPHGTHTFKCLASNGTCIGELYPEVDGFYVYDPGQTQGYITEQILMELAIKLSELNDEWNKEITRELKSRPAHLTIESLAFDDPFTNTRTGELF